MDQVAPYTCEHIAGEHVAELRGSQVLARGSAPRPISVVDEGGVHRNGVRSDSRGHLVGFSSFVGLWRAGR